MTTRSFESRLDGMFDEDIATGRRLVFVQGLWRSGTSWVGRMLDSTPQIYVCPHELHSFMCTLEVRQFNQPLATSPFLTSRFEAGRKAGFVSMLQQLHRVEKPGATWIGERSPGADVAAVKAAFPESKMIIVLRDGRDVCVSQAFLARQMGTDPGCIDERTSQVSLRYLGDHAVLYERCLPEYFALKAAHPDDVVLVRDEDLRRDPVAGMREVFACLRMTLSETEVEVICRRHAFAADAKHTAAKDGGDAWMRRGEVGDWRNHLSPASVTVYEDLAGRALEMGGYELSRPRTSRRTDAVLPSAVADLHSKVAGMVDEELWSGRRLFFIQGLWHSGTERVSRMLTGNLTAYICQHQLQSFMREVGRAPSGRLHSGNPFVKTRIDLTRKAGFLAALLRLRDLERPTANRIGDHSPGADVGQVREAFPEARQVIVLRDGRDICVSASAGPVLSLRDVVSQAVLYSTFVADYLALQAAHPGGVLLVKYEDVQADPAGQLKRIADFLEIVAEPGREDVQPWREEMPQLAPKHVATFQMIAGHALQQAGYTLTGAAAKEPFPTASLIAFREVFQLLNDLGEQVEAAPSAHRSIRLGSVHRRLWKAANQLFAGRLDLRDVIENPPRAGRRRWQILRPR